jgi:hypothetical protein
MAASSCGVIYEQKWYWNFGCFGKNHDFSEMSEHFKKRKRLQNDKSLGNGAATIRATQHIINASHNQSQRFFHLSSEPQML